MHEDFDRPDGAEYDKTRTRVQAALTKELGSAHYVLSVWEMEAWLLLFPEALTGLVASWKVLVQHRNGDTGMLHDPKKILMQKVSAQHRRYRESDAPDVLAKAVALGCLDRPRGSNRSWQQLRSEAGDCCRLHLSHRGRTR